MTQLTSKLSPSFVGDSAASLLNLSYHKCIRNWKQNDSEWNIISRFFAIKVLILYRNIFLFLSLWLLWLLLSLLLYVSSTLQCELMYNGTSISGRPMEWKLFVYQMFSYFVWYVLGRHRVSSQQPNIATYVKYYMDRVWLRCACNISCHV